MKIGTVICLFFSMSFVWAHGARVKCIKFSSGCYACSDGRNRPRPISRKDSKNDALISLEACLESYDKTLGKGGCAKLSKTCSVCGRGTFISNRDQKKIDSDLFECLTTPKSYQSMPER